VRYAAAPANKRMQLTRRGSLLVGVQRALIFIHARLAADPRCWTPTDALAEVEGLTTRHDITTGQLALAMGSIAGALGLAALLTRETPHSAATLGFLAAMGIILGGVLPALGIVAIIHRLRAGTSGARGMAPGRLFARAFACIFGVVTMAAALVAAAAVVRSIARLPWWTTVLLGAAVPVLFAYGLCLIRLALTNDPGRIYSRLIGERAP
jgi:hypothetical protein